MTNNSRFIIGVIIVSIFIFFLFFCERDESETTIYNLEIAEGENNLWHVFDREGNNRGTLEVSPSDRINWEAVNSDMEFRFEVDVREFFDFEDDLFSDNMTQYVNEGEVLSLRIKSDAPEDTLEYPVYVVEADTFVVGNSPPVMIIKSRK